MKQAALLAFLQEVPFPETLRAHFFSLDSFASNQDLFLGFASVFTPAFPGLSPAQELLLNAAVYLGAKGIYHLDNVWDLQVAGEKRTNQAYQGQLFLLESQRMLSQLFPFQDDFWREYYGLLTKHFQELTLSKNIDEPLTEQAYQELLAHKYAMLYCPVNALFSLTGKKHPSAYRTILDSLQWFCKGYNLPNEVMGLTEDLHLQINNYAYWRLQEYLLPMDIQVQDYSYEDLHKMLYASELAVTLMDEAIEALTQAAQLVSPLELVDYQKLIYRLIDNVRQKKEFLLPYSANIH
ncbi:hypothetical protein AHMF7605_28595 [Adhaeribacter arboris]|uniref:Heptaprenyl diphosphate synthase n=1 Tax=Adhaeribacter arboris TaxID=2072846 RepID=A0A2T2Y8Q0_9BACT|nr:hypothetical protein [Adhaeribacter arboris]PSR51873.1 hypothetical protein AHMF7605_28595 [Adhaeribacter arboris]